VSKPRTHRKCSVLSFLETSDSFVCYHQSAVLNQQPPRGRAGNPSLTLNSILMRPQSPSSWLSRMFVDDSPSALRRVLSPDSWFKCKGDCQKMKLEEQKAAHVVRMIWSWFIYLRATPLGFIVGVS
jgi:hypothetical protein